MSKVTYWEESFTWRQTSIRTIHSLFYSVISRVVGQISSLLATSLYENHQYIKDIIVFMSNKDIVFMSNKVYVPHLSTAGVEVSKVCFSPWYLVLSTLFVLTYPTCIRSPLRYYIPHFKRELCRHHVRDPESTRLRKKHLLSSTSSELTYNFPSTNYRYCTIRKCNKK